MTPQPADYGRGPFGALRRFWLQPNDPTVLGFIRVMAGCVVVYVHLAFCFDLQAFFGPDAWWDQKAANLERKESPIYAAPLVWPDHRPVIRVPDSHDRREALTTFLSRLPDSPQARTDKLRFYFKTIPENSVEAQRRAMDFVGRLNAMYKLSAGDGSPDAELPPEVRRDQRAAFRKAFAGPGPNQIADVPKFIEDLPTEKKEEIADSIVDFIDILAAWNKPSRMIMEYFNDYPTNERMVLRRYLESLPVDRAERQRRVDYIATWGMDESQVYTKGRTLFSPWFHVSEPWQMWALHAVTLMIMVMFTVGYQTRITSVLTWVLALGYLHRTMHIVFGMDAMMSIVLLYLMIGPSGAAVSIDRLLERRRAARAIRLAGGLPVPWADRALAGPRHSVMANIAIRMIQVHFCFIYMSSGLSKLKGTMWWDGTAGWFTVANPEFSPIQYHVYEDLMRWIAGQRFLSAITLGMVNYGTLFLEIGLPFLVWGWLRPVIIMLAIMLHTGIAVMMGLNGFGLLMLCLLMGYMPAAVVRSWLGGNPSKQRKLQLHYSPEDPSQQNRVEILRSLDTQGQIEFVADAKGGELRSVEGKQTRFGEDAFAWAGRSLRVTRALPGLFTAWRLLFARTPSPNRTPPARRREAARVS